MRRLLVDPEQHFAEADYAGSEVLIFRHDADPGQVLLCCNDLSERISDWAHGTGPPHYASRYRIFRFLDVDDYHRVDVDDIRRGVADDFLVTREELRVPLDDIEATADEDMLSVRIVFERGFGQSVFVCREVMISEVTTEIVNGSGGRGVHLVEANTPVTFDEDVFLTQLYISEPPSR